MCIFTDDIVLMSEASLALATYLLNASHKFGDCTGSNIIKSKSMNMFSPNNNNGLKSSLVNVLGTKELQELLEDNWATHYQVK